METRVLHSILDISPGEWNSIVTPNHLICRHEYLRAVEASEINDCRFCYPVVYEGGKIVAHACLYSINTELDTFAKGLVKKAISGIRGVWENFLILRTVECGSPVSLGTTISFGQGVDRPGALREIVRQAEAEAAGLGIKVVLFRDFHDHELPLFDCLLRAGYRRVGNLPSTTLTVRWSSFEEYLDSMRRLYRRKIIAQLRKFEGNGGTVEVTRDFAPYAADLARLWRNAYDNAKEYRREVLREPFFSSMDKHLGKASAAVILRVEGHAAGFALLLYDGDTLIPLYCGLDYSYNEKYCIYFNLLYAVVRVAIAERVKVIDFGITTLAPKLDLGAVVEPLHMYMRHTGPVFGRLAPRLFDMMTPPLPVQSRRVFKTDDTEC